MKLKLKLLPVILSVLGLLITYNLYQNARSAAVKSLQADFDFQTRETLLRIEQRLDTYSQVLHGAKGLFLASDRVTRTDFQNYVSNQRLSINYPGIQGVGFTQIVPKDAIKQHIDAIRAQGFPDYTLWPDGARDLYSAIVYLEPFAARNLRAFGYDMYSEPVRQKAMSRARDFDMPSLSGKVKLVQETETDIQAGFLVYLPLYAKQWPHDTIEQRRYNIMGWVYAPFRMHDFLHGILGEQNLNLNLAIYDGTVMTTDALLYQNTPAGFQPPVSTSEAQFTSANTLEMMGHAWTIKLHSTPAFEANLNTWPATLIAISGSIITLLLALLFYTLLKSRARALAHSLELSIAATVFESQEGMFVTDAQTRIIRINRAFTRLTGYTEQEAIGQKPTLLKSGHHVKNFYTQLWMRLSGQGTWEGEIWNRRKNGEIFPEYLAITAVKNTQGKLTHYVGVFRDITQNKRAESAIAANKAKSEFLANMSHEIRTPMNGVIGMIDVLQSTSLNERQEQIVEVIRNSAHTQLAILNDILDFSKIEAGKLQLAQEPINLEKIVENVCFMLDQMAISKRVNLKVFVDPKIPSRVNADPLRLSQILTNLVNNAIKFSSGLPYLGEVHLRAELSDFARDRLWINFIIKDNGIGMDESTQQRLFQQFEQADLSTTRRYGGTGLGLAICNQLIELMQGDIHVHSQVNQGSVFTVRLPLDLCAEQPPAESFNLAGLCCWVLSEKVSLCRDLLTFLFHAGLKVQTGRPDDPVALEQSRGHVTLIVMEGETTPLLSDWPVFAPQELQKHLVIMQKTDSCGRRRKIRRLASGALQVDINILTRRNLFTALAVAAGLRELEADAIESDTALDTAEIITRDQAISQNRLILAVEDNEVNQAVIINQLQLLGYVCDMTANGREALAHWRRQNYALLLTDLHMPEMDGYQLCSAIRQQEQHDNRFRTPIIALTAIALKGEEQHCQAIGMDDYLSKPVTLSMLKAKLDKWLPETEPIEPEPDDLPCSVPSVRLTRDQALQQHCLILVVEDNEVNQQVIHEQIKLLGFVADIARNGREALALLRKQCYALILSDIHMPIMDGYQLTAVIRRWEAKNGAECLPIIALTAIALKGEDEHCKAVGMNDYLSKPTPLSELALMLNKWLPTAHAALLESMSTAPPDTATASTDWNRDTLTAIVGNNPAVIARFLTLFINQAEEQIKNILKAHASGDLKTVGVVAHTLKSAARSVGALRLGDLCQRLEMAGKASDEAVCANLINDMTQAFAVVRPLIEENLN